MKNPTTTLVISLLLSIGSVVAIVWLIFEEYYIFLIFFLLVIVLCIVKIVSIFNSSQRKISFMFNAIDCDDYLFKFSETALNVNEKALNASLNRIKNIMNNAKQRVMEREEYYELIMNSVRTGVVTINSRGNVYQVNSEAKRILGMEVFTHINQLNSFAPNLTKAMKYIRPEELLQVSFTNERGEMKLSLNASEMMFDNKRLKIIAVNDINNALDEKEVESWVKLTRVLTHEIMNSLAPITSLSETLIDINKDKKSDVAQGLEIINSTSKSLVSFVDSYRKFTRIQQPVNHAFNIKSLLVNNAKLICSLDTK